MKNKLLVAFIAILVSYISCHGEEKVWIRISKANGVYQTEVSSSTKELRFGMGGIHVNYVEGFEKLHELTKLDIGIGDNEIDYSFIKEMPKLKILIITGSYITDLDFLKRLKELEVLILDFSHIYKNELDLISNQKLKYLSIRSLGYIPPHGGIQPFVLNIKNIPQNLKYAEIGSKGYLLLTTEYVNKFIDIPYVMVENPEGIQYWKEFVPTYNEFKKNLDFINKHRNFTFEDPKKILPEEYRVGVLYNRDSDSAYAKSNIYLKMQKVSEVY